MINERDSLRTAVIAARHGFWSYFMGLLIFNRGRDCSLIVPAVAADFGGMVTVCVKGKYRTGIPR